MSIDVQVHSEDYAAVNMKASDLGVNRKVIFATNVAETGVTFNMLRHVIDTGYQNFVFYDPTRDVKHIINTYPVSKDSAEQRAGRVGRNAEGFVHRLMTEETYNLLREVSHPGLYTEMYWHLYLWVK